MNIFIIIITTTEILTIHAYAFNCYNLMIIYNLSVSQLVGRDTGPVPNGSLHPRGLPLSPHFRDVMPL